MAPLHSAPNFRSWRSSPLLLFSSSFFVLTLFLTSPPIISSSSFSLYASCKSLFSLKSRPLLKSSTSSEPLGLLGWRTLLSQPYYSSWTHINSAENEDFPDLIYGWFLGKSHSLSLFPVWFHFEFESQIQNFPPPMEGLINRRHCLLGFSQTSHSFSLYNFLVPSMNSSINTSATTTMDPTINTNPLLGCLDQQFLDEELSPIVLEDEPQPMLQQALNLTLAGKLISQRKPTLSNLKYLAARQWGCIDRVEAYDLGKKLYSFQFLFVDDKLQALQGGPWFIDGGLLLVDEININIPVEKMAFSHSNIWIRIHDLPPKGFTSKMGRAVGNALGIFKEADVHDKEGSGGSVSFHRQPNIQKYLRIKVYINIAKPLKRKQLINVRGDTGNIEAYTVRLSYEHLPEVCYCCGIIGHGFASCSRYDESIELPYGDWIRSDKFYKSSSYQQSSKRISPSDGSSKLPSPCASEPATGAQLSASPTNSQPITANSNAMSQPCVSNPQVSAIPAISSSKPPMHPSTATYHTNPLQFQFGSNPNAWYSPYSGSPLILNQESVLSPMPNKTLFSPSDIVLPNFSPFPDSYSKVPPILSNNQPTQDPSPNNAILVAAECLANNTTCENGSTKSSVGQKRKFKAAVAEKSKVGSRGATKEKSNSNSPRKRGKASASFVNVSTVEGMKGKSVSNTTH